MIDLHLMIDGYYCVALMQATLICPHSYSNRTHTPVRDQGVKLVKEDDGRRSTAGLEDREGPMGDYISKRGYTYRYIAALFYSLIRPPRR